MSEIIVLNDRDVEDLVSFEDNLRMIEQVFGDYNLGKSHAFPVVREEIKRHKGIFGIKSGYLETNDVLGFKAGGFWADNKTRGLANHQSVIVLFDPETGRTRAFVAANFVTQIRTAAIGAVGCKYLARPDSRILAVIGTGQQGRNQLKAALQVLPGITGINMYDRDQASAEAFAGDIAECPQTITVYADAEKACVGADIIITATSSYAAIVMADWVNSGTHINAIGTDTRGKQELDPVIFQKAKIVVDNIKQCLYLGECQHAYDAGLITAESIHAEIGEIINGAKPGRLSDREVTVFDTTGVAIQDLATAGYAVEEAIKKNRGGRISL
jgi:alanine dehydrogenase